MTRERRLRALEERMAPDPVSEPLRILRPIIAADGAVVAIIDRTSGEVWNREDGETEEALFVRARLTGGETFTVLVQKLDAIAAAKTTNRPRVAAEIEQ